MIAIATILLVLSVVSLGHAENASPGFSDVGVAVPVSFPRGTVATKDSAGHNIVLSWLYDHRGGYALLLIDAATGKTDQFPVPFAPDGDGPFASLLSSRNKYYTHFNNYFAEFDVSKRAFTFCRKAADKTAMSMTEDDKGTIWSATYPKCAIVSYSPESGQFKDYGPIYKQNWDEYPRFVAADDKGWIYLALGFTASQIIAFNPSSGVALPILAEGERKRGLAYVYRDIDGKVYGRALEPDNNGWYPDGKMDPKALERETTGWYELYEGARIKLGEHKLIRQREIITGNQGLFHRPFPDGRRIADLDLSERRLVVEDSRMTSQRKELHLDYASDGASVMDVSATPGGTVFGATMFPFYFFSYDPRTDQRANRPCYYQWNAVVSQGEKVFVGGYAGGILLEWDPSLPWETDRTKAGWNPRDLGAWANPIVHRPSKLLALPDGRTIVMAGTPDYGLTGGGLEFWDRESRKAVLLGDSDVIPNQSTNAMVVLSGGKILGGTTTEAGTGGARKAREPELYVMDIATKKVIWHQAVIQGVQEYTDLCQGPQGLIYGIANMHHFFIFDPVTRKLVSQEDVGARFGPTIWQQGPRLFVPGPNENVYVLFKKGIARIDPKTHAMTWLADAPVPITAGGVYLNGRIWFVGDSSHLYSYRTE